jgi:LAO/AO transport system kinase
MSLDLEPALEALLAGVLSGDRLSLARLLTQVENDTPAGRSALDRLFARTGRAHLVGVTGSPGTGKSSLVNRLAKSFRAAGVGRVAVIAVDPTSPFSGGALLGDRVRMRDLAGDEAIFIRSMASRGALGGLARTTAAFVQVLDAAGYDLVLIETVGAGQSEIDIARLAHTVLVVEAPGLGDEIQAIKAGILEIADILVVNKADLPGAELTARALKAMLEMAHPTRPGQVNAHSFWMPPVLMTTSTGMQPVDVVVEAITSHRAFLESSGEWQRREQERLQNTLEMLVRERLAARWRAGLPPGKLDEALRLLACREISPNQAVDDLLGE